MNEDLMRRLLQASPEAMDGGELPQLGTAAEPPAPGHLQSARTAGGLRGPWRAVSRALHLPYAPKDTATDPALSKVTQATKFCRFDGHVPIMFSSGVLNSSTNSLGKSMDAVQPVEASLPCLFMLHERKG